MEIPDIGPAIETSLVATVSTGSSIGKGRDLTAWLGLVPQQITTVGKPATESTPMPVIYTNARFRSLPPFLCARELGFSIDDIRGILNLSDGAAPVWAEDKARTDRHHADI